MTDPFPEIKSKHSLVAKYVTAPLWEKLSGVRTATSGFSLAKAIACAVQFDNQVRTAGLVIVSQLKFSNYVNVDKLFINEAKSVAEKIRLILHV